MKAFSNLQKLGLRSTKVTDAGLAHLKHGTAAEFGIPAESP